MQPAAQAVPTASVFAALLVLSSGVFALALAAEGATTATTTTTTSTTLSIRGRTRGSVSCASVATAGSASKLEAAALRALQPAEASTCVALLGKDPLEDDQARAVWDLLLEEYGTADMIPDETLRLLGWTSAGIPPEHMFNLSLGEVDTVTALGTFHNLSLQQLTALAESVRYQWAAKEPEDLTHVDLGALNHILCGFNATDIARVHADAYREASGKLSLLRCPGTPGAVSLLGGGAGGQLRLPALLALAALAESADGFGDPGRWTAAAVRAVGCVLVGLPAASLARVPSSALHTMLQGLAGSDQPVISRCLLGTPDIAQRLASSDQAPEEQAVTSAPGNSTASSASSGHPSRPGATSSPGGSGTNATTVMGFVTRGRTAARGGGSGGCRATAAGFSSVSAIQKINK